MKPYLKISFAVVFFIPKIISAQEIKFIDTTIEKGYFYLISYSPQKARKQVGYAVGKQNEFYFIDKEKMFNSIDSTFYSQRYILDDTSKYFAYIPNLDKYNFIKQMFENNKILSLYEKGINLTNEIKPEIFYKIRMVKKFHKGTRIGLTYVKVKWLHLKIIDRIAFNYFNNPYTLNDPYIVPKFYDIYFPLEILDINNNVKLKKRRILLRMQ